MESICNRPSEKRVIVRVKTYTLSGRKQDISSRHRKDSKLS